MPVVLNVEELTHFLGLAEQELGDPSASCFLLAAPFFAAMRDPALGIYWDNQKRELLIDFGGPRPMPIRVDMDGPVIEDGQLQAFHVRKVCAGVWALSPSLNMPEVLHAFILIHGAPDPAPWERLIIL